MSCYKVIRKVTVNNVAELQNALRDESAEQPITGPLGEAVLLRWLQDRDTDEIIIEVDSDDGD